jgi:hypothetical protein
VSYSFNFGHYVRLPPWHSLCEPAEHLSDILLADDKWHRCGSFQEPQDQVNHTGLLQVYRHWF